MGYAGPSPVKLGIEAGNALPTPIPLCMPPFPRRHLTLPTFVPDFSGRNNSLMPKVTLEAKLMLTSRINKNISKHQTNVLDFISRIAVETNCTSLRHLVLNIFVHKQFTMCRDSNGSLNCFTSRWNTHTVWEFRAACIFVAPIPFTRRAKPQRSWILPGKELAWLCSNSLKVHVMNTLCQRSFRPRRRREVVFRCYGNKNAFYPGNYETPAR